MYGYRQGDAGVPTIKVNENDDGKGVIDHTLLDNTHIRKPMGILQSHRVKGIARPVVDRDDVTSSVLGAMHRVSPKMPGVEDPEEYKEFSMKVFETFLDPLEMDEIITFIEYLDGTSKGQGWKDNRLEEHQNREKDFKCGGARTMSSFIKDEDYDTWKHARLINGTSKQSYRDDVLGFQGRYVKSCEKAVYHKLPGLVKSLTPHERAELMTDLGDYHTKTIGDYKSYESSFSAVKMECVQIAFYEFMFSRLPEGKQVVDAVRRLLTGKNRMKFKGFTWTCMARKMSGETDTALSNALDNLVSWMYVLWKKHGITIEQAGKMVYVEGDDNASNLLGHKVEEEDFEQLGLKIVLDDGLEIQETGFCQLYFGMPYNGVICANPWKKLAKFPRVPIRYQGAGSRVFNSLLRAQALSMLYVHRGAPVVHKLALKLLQLTSGVNIRDSHANVYLNYGLDPDAIRHLDWREFVDMDIDDNDRVLVEGAFGMTVEMQHYIEAQIESWDGGLLDLPIEWFPEEYSIAHDLYVCDTEVFEWYSPQTDRRRELEILISSSVT